MSDVPPRLIDSERRRSKARDSGTIALLLLGAAILNPDHPLPFDTCGFKYLTGVPCPTCGLTRALCHAVRGNWTMSLAYHPAGLLVLIAFVGWASWSAAEAASGRTVGEGLRRRLGIALLAAGVTLSIAFWILRISGTLHV